MGDWRDELVEDVTEDEQEEEASLQQERGGGDRRDELLDDDMEVEQEGCCPECSESTGRRLVYFKGNGFAHKARCSLSDEEAVTGSDCAKDKSIASN